jgi:hypothetical protein
VIMWFYCFYWWPYYGQPLPSTSPMTLTKQLHDWLHLIWVNGGLLIGC